jgi:uncharacterized protein YkwD
MKEIRILLTEQTFTELCKRGTVEHKRPYSSSLEVRMTKDDIKRLAAGEIISKEDGEQEFKIALQDIGSEMIEAIIKRSPLYGN